MKPAASDPRLVWAILLGATFVAYSAVFEVSRGAPLMDNLRAAGLNTGSLGLTALAARGVIRRWILPLSSWRQAILHLTAAIVFAVAWAWLLFLVTGIALSGSLERFAVVPFLQGPAQQWQLMQGLFAYAAIAALTMVEHRPAGALLVLDSASPEYRQRFLLKRDGGVLSLSTSGIVSVIGADDYAEIVTAERTHLVSTTLAEMEAALDPRCFLRVHRSAIANLDQIERADPIGGGRMRLSMTRGPDLSVSRTGARLLRERLL